MAGINTDSYDYIKRKEGGGIDIFLQKKELRPAQVPTPRPLL